MARIHSEYSLKKRNSFGINARAALFCRPENIEELSEILETYDYQNAPLLIIGEGSNILLRDDFHGLVINPGMTGIDVLEEDETSVLISAGAAEQWDHLVSYTTRKGWYGLENLSLIPGSAGSAPVQNIGAYGTELKNHFVWLDAWDLQQKKEVRLDNESCRFGYRNSIFKGKARGRYIITHVTFRLHKQPRLNLGYGNLASAFSAAGGKTPEDLRNLIISIRRQKLPDPEQHGNAGSFFKNPVVDRTIFKCIRVDHPEIPSYPDINNQVKIPAAWLIEQTGWKGKRIGNVGTWPLQPLVIVNYNGASGTEIFDFSEKIREDVEKKFGITLEREVTLI